MLLCHDFINGEYYEDFFTGETISVEEHYERESQTKLHQKYQHYILIESCESIINQNKFFCDFSRWYYPSNEKQPTGTVILSENEYIKNEKKTAFYRCYQGEHYNSLKVLKNKQLPLEKVEELYGFLLCRKKGNGKLYTKEQFIEEFLR